MQAIKMCLDIKVQLNCSRISIIIPLKRESEKQFGPWTAHSDRSYSVAAKLTCVLSWGSRILVDLGFLLSMFGPVQAGSFLLYDGTLSPHRFQLADQEFKYSAFVSTLAYLVPTFKNRKIEFPRILRFCRPGTSPIFPLEINVLNVDSGDISHSLVQRFGFLAYSMSNARIAYVLSR